MINLIPNEEKKKKVLDFYFRLSVVFLMVLGSAMIIASVSILPSYLLSSVKKNTNIAKLESIKNTPLPQDDQKTLLAVSDLNNRLTMIENGDKNKYLVSENVISEIILRKMSDIKITQISYSNGTNQDRTILVNGYAPSRDRLLLFKQALVNDPKFKSVDLPISNFIKGSNISFSLTLLAK
ncbi:MAG: hypothetical protein ABIS26_01995 [Candidatus Paceibacterota bacterium]